MTFFERVFWKNIFKHMIAVSSIWDFYLQYAFFKYRMFSVYPRWNLVENIGFGNDATHTRNGRPQYIIKSSPDCSRSVMNLPQLEDLSLYDRERDDYMVRTIWGYSWLRTIRLSVMNVIRYLMV